MWKRKAQPEEISLNDLPGAKKLIGRWGEEVTAEHYRKHGWNVLGMGYRCRYGEIDVIVEKQGLIAFVEVKLRKNASYAMAREQVTYAKQQRLRRTAELWLAQYGNDRCARFDVVEIYAPFGMETKNPRIVVVEDAFS